MSVRYSFLDELRWLKWGLGRKAMLDHRKFFGHHLPTFPLITGSIPLTIMSQIIICNIHPIPKNMYMKRYHFLWKNTHTYWKITSCALDHDHITWYQEIWLILLDEKILKRELKPEDPNRSPKFFPSPPMFLLMNASIKDTHVTKK